MCKNKIAYIYIYVLFFLEKALKLHILNPPVQMYKIKISCTELVK